MAFHVLHRSGYVGEIQPQTGETEMLRNEIRPGTLLPPGVVEENEINVNETLQEWANYPGLEPAFVTNLRVSQPSKAKSDGGADTEALLPAGVK